MRFNVCTGPRCLIKGLLSAGGENGGERRGFTTGARLVGAETTPALYLDTLYTSTEWVRRGLFCFLQGG